MKISMNVQKSPGFRLLQVPFGHGATSGLGIRVGVESHNQLLKTNGLGY